MDELKKGLFIRAILIKMQRGLAAEEAINPYTKLSIEEKEEILSEVNKKAISN